VSPIFWLALLVPAFFSGWWMGAWSMRRYYVERLAFERKLRGQRFSHPETLDLTAPEAREITKEWRQ
jgi:hypothetical protein